MKKITLFIVACLFVTLNVNAQYCIPELPDACSPEEINLVSISDLENASGCAAPGYTFYSDLTANLDQGESYDLTVTVIADPGFPQSQVFAFFDWNQDEEWDTSTERYTIAEQPLSSGTYTISIDVPEDALEGETRMRIVLVYGTGALTDYDGCTDYLYGEIEDYVVNVNVLSVADNDIEGFNYFYSTQSKNLTIAANTELSSISIFNLIGQEVIGKNLNSTNEVLNLSNLKDGVYIANVTAGGNTTTFKIVKR